MKRFDIYITYLSWGQGGKDRPVILYALDNTTAKIYPITSQYQNKSTAIKSKYFVINEWREAGLDMQSYVDIGTIISQPLQSLNDIAPIGTLTENDKRRLIKFIDKAARQNNRSKSPRS